MNTEAAARVLLNRVHALLCPLTLVGHGEDAGGKPPPRKNCRFMGTGAYAQHSQFPPRGSSAEIPDMGSPAVGGQEGRRDSDEGQQGSVQPGRDTSHPR